MHSALTPAERNRLVGILSRLASEFDGERAAAGLLASRMLKSAGLTWEDLLGPQIRPDSSAAEQPSAAGMHRRSDFGSDMATCQRHLRRLTDWEQGFCLSMVTARKRSPKQVSILRDIATSLRGRGLA